MPLNFAPVVVVLYVLVLPFLVLPGKCTNNSKTKHWMMMMATGAVAAGVTT